MSEPALEPGCRKGTVGTHYLGSIVVAEILSEHVSCPLMRITRRPWLAGSSCFEMSQRVRGNRFARQWDGSAIRRRGCSAPPQPFSGTAIWPGMTWPGMDCSLIVCTTGPASNNHPSQRLAGITRSAGRAPLPDPNRESAPATLPAPIAWPVPPPGPIPFRPPD